jgi:predicted DNA-binding protein
MPRRVFSIRLPEDLAANAEMVARIEGKPMSGFITDAIAAQIEATRADPDFQRRLRERIEADERIIARLT